MIAENCPSVLSVLRERTGLTPGQLAEQAGVPESVVAIVESDGRPVLASEEARLANALRFAGHPKGLREPFDVWRDHEGEILTQAAEVVRIDPELMSGEACFPGTRVPVQTLVDYLKAGDSLEYFLVQHATVTREQAQDFIQAAANLVVSQTKTSA